LSAVYRIKNILEALSIHNYSMQTVALFHVSVYI